MIIQLYYYVRRFWLFSFLLLLNLNATEVIAARSLFETTEIGASYLVQAQNPDGGWPLIAGGESDVEITALVMQALMFTGWGTGSSVIRRGVVYLIAQQKEDGSWNGNTVHTTFVLMALAQAGTDAEARFKGLKWLKGVQNEDGSWGREIYQPGNPLYTGAILAGLRRLGFKQSFSPIPKATSWLEKRINVDGGWSLARGGRSNVLVTSWVLQGLSLVYDIDAQLAWLKQMQNKDGGFGIRKSEPSDPEITAYAILALVAGGDPLNTDKVAIGYLREIQQEDGSFVSATPIEIKTPKANLQTTSFVLWAIYARQAEESSE